ncbi:MAG: EAL domain-containing protein [Chloroflexaceae bacterium]|nr:EAL domain-containing protein [Chloroflexaceae bacterium]
MVLADLPHIAERALREWHHLTERQRTEKALYQSERRFRALIEHSSDVISVLDVTGVIRYSSPSTMRIVGYPLDDYQGCNIFELIHPDDLPIGRAFIVRLLDCPDGNMTTELRLRHHDASWRWIDVTGTNLLDDPAVQGIVLNYRDITERKRFELQLQHDALHDALTGLPNRVLLVDRIEQAIKRNQQDEHYQFAVLFLDLDHFKVVNDSRGHTVGDQLLMAVTSRLQECLRASDTCARFGGDEFVVLLERISGLDDATQAAACIQTNLSRPFHLSDLTLVVSASIGIVVSNVGYEQSEEVLRDADIAMYYAKSRGKAQYAVFDVTMRAPVLARLALEEDLRRALERHEFRVYYQPIISLAAGDIRGFEALVRWQHPHRGLVGPSEFIGVAEETGLIEDIDWLVLREASRQLQEWHERMPWEPLLSMNVNLSGKQFTRPDLAAQIEQVLRETRLDPHSLRIEITESTLMENMAVAATTLHQLHALGVSIAIDDFGTGYSSLNYLLNLPIHVLKIDRSFISQIETDRSQHEIVSTIIMLSHKLGLQVVAEGVETTTQRAQLCALGCEYGQGYLISRPVDSARASALLMSMPALHRYHKVTDCA